MGRYSNSGTGVGTSGSPQISLSQNEYDKKVEELSKKDSSIESTFTSDQLSYEDSIRKIKTYLLNVDHPVGGPKAKFFIEILGYSRDKSKQFFDGISEAINGKQPYKKSETNYGTVLEFHEKIRAVSGKYEYANIVVAIQRDNGKTTYRIITAYPDKKGE